MTRMEQVEQVLRELSDRTRESIRLAQQDRKREAWAVYRDKVSPRLGELLTLLSEEMPREARAK